ncbi:hypothetical protein AA313_de0205201 [Arthrobotrys entomopaga]|nr:hypothetical protein AA313_de0205201 [Arthrobotrys entomopaga]
MPKRTSGPKGTDPEAVPSSEGPLNASDPEAPPAVPKDKIPPFPWPKARTRGKYAPWGKRIVGEDSDDSIDEDRVIDPSFFRNINLNDPCPFFTKEELKKENRINEIFGRKDKTKPYWQHVPRSAHSIPTASWTDQIELITGKPVDFSATKAPPYKPMDIPTGIGANILDFDDLGDDAQQSSGEQGVTDGTQKEQEQETQIVKPHWFNDWFRRHFPPPSEWDPDEWPAVLRDLYLNIRGLRGMFQGPNWRFQMLMVFCLHFGAVMALLVGFGVIRAYEMRVVIQHFRLV